MKVVFLDRDGVINKYPGQGRYVTSLNEFEFIPGSIEGLRKLYKNDFKLFVTSNQAGVAKGLYAGKVLEKINQRLIRELKKNAVKLSGIYYCTHKNEDGCLCRKPKTGLMEQALSDCGLKPDLSFVIGDSFKDMEAARRFGAKSILVLSGKEKISGRNSWKFEPDYVFDNLLIAAHYLCSHYGKNLDRLCQFRTRT
jgi:D-glycero-D-manno-heptose 1,7-bisphosphate phosphatase